MKFGVFYEHQLPRPWEGGQEKRILDEALEQVVLADQLGIDFAWEVEHHFLEEYSHSSAPEVFLAAAAALTKRIRLGHGIRQVIPHYNHPARVAEAVATLDLISGGRVEFGIGEGATRHEIHGFNIPAKEKRALSLEAAEQIANMMTMTPYPGFEGKGFRMPCRNVIPKPMQKPHPPMWIACTNRETIKLAAQLGLGALAFSFIDPEEARGWASTYYSILKSEACVPLGHRVNPNIAMVSGFSVHHDGDEAVRRGQEGFEFFGYALQSLIFKPSVPGRTTLFQDFQRERAKLTSRPVRGAAGIGTPEQVKKDLESFEAAGVDQVIFLQQAGNNRHDHICESLKTFAGEVMPHFAALEPERERKKQAELAPFVEAALARKPKLRPLADGEIPVIEPIVKATLPL
jgi:alkanesulfonate monooxygenase SsuD/methylene tetrahydromethanopterin reductase-like flavin-dependent oxidoreductase (luciferase family)